MSYHSFINHEDGSEYGSFEVFYNTADPTNGHVNLAENDGWFWWSCFIGCLPDSEPVGPFGSEHEAMSDAQGSG